MFCADSAALGILPTSVKYRSDKTQAFSDTPVLPFSVRDHKVRPGKNIRLGPRSEADQTIHSRLKSAIVVSQGYYAQGLGGTSQCQVARDQFVPEWPTSPHECVRKSGVGASE